MFSSVSFDKADFSPKVLTCIDQSGLIDRIISVDEPDYKSVKQTAENLNILHPIPKGSYLLPGFIDLHVHAPQWPQAGLALDKPLDEWLQKYTFPLEVKYKDLNFAKENYTGLVNELLENGTTTVLYFGSIHTDANLVLADICAEAGQRAFIGKVAMDNPTQTPEYYRDSSSKESLEQTELFINRLLDKQKKTGAELTPVITPRFVPSCTDETLAGLGNLAKKYDLPIQSHCSESIWEDHYAIERFNLRDTQVLDKFHLLTSKSIMAHATQLNDSDLELFKQRNTAIAHCPISNVYFGNSVLPVKHIHEKNINMGMGTDISGGFSPSIYRNIQQSVMSSQMLQDNSHSDSRISATNAFYLATIGGAKALHIKTGQISVGYKADFQIVTDQYFNSMSNEPQDVFERLIYHTTKSEINEVYVSGKQVINRGEHHGRK
nr:guanine deaminase [Companilactobacillus allii]